MEMLFKVKSQLICATGYMSTTIKHVILAIYNIYILICMTIKIKCG